MHPNSFPNKQHTTAHLNANIQQINLRIDRGQAQLLPTTTELHIINTVPRLKPPRHLIRLSLTPPSFSHRRIEQNHFAVLPRARHNLPKLPVRLRDPHHRRSALNSSLSTRLLMLRKARNRARARHVEHFHASISTASAPHKTRSIPRIKLTARRLRRHHLHHLALVAAVLEHCARLLIVPQLFLEFQKSGLL